jgi:hypothetical protein
MRSIWTPPAVRPQLGGLCLGAHITGLVAVQALISSNYAKIMLGNLELSTPDEGLSLGVRYWRSCRGTDDQVVLPDGDARFRPLRLHDRIGRLRSLARPGRAGAHAVSAPTGACSVNVGTPRQPHGQRERRQVHDPWASGMWLAARGTGGVLCPACSPDWRGCEGTIGGAHAPLRWPSPSLPPACRGCGGACCAYRPPARDIEEM